VLLDGMDKADLIAINTDVQSLELVAARKVQLVVRARTGSHRGDPDSVSSCMNRGRDRQAIAGARMILFARLVRHRIGAAPIVAQLARKPARS